MSVVKLGAMHFESASLLFSIKLGRDDKIVVAQNANGALHLIRCVAPRADRDIRTATHLKADAEQFYHHDFEQLHKIIFQLYDRLIKEACVGFDTAKSIAYSTNNSHKFACFVASLPKAWSTGDTLQKSIWSYSATFKNKSVMWLDHFPMWI